jgi:Gram-negative bacterial TonB protein C-terminal
MLGRVIVSLLCVALASGCAVAQADHKSQFQPVRVSPSTTENQKVDVKLLRRGTQVLVRAIISKTGEIRNVEFIKGNADLMPEVRKTLRTWKYKPYLYQGHAVEVETTIYVNFDLLTGG